MEYEKWNDEMKKRKTKKEINQRIYQIFDECKTSYLSEIESSRITELLWALGINRNKFKNGGRR